MHPVRRPPMLAPLGAVLGAVAIAALGSVPLAPSAESAELPGKATITASGIDLVHPEQFSRGGHVQVAVTSPDTVLPTLHSARFSAREVKDGHVDFPIPTRDYPDGYCVAAVYVSGRDTPDIVWSGRTPECTADFPATDAPPPAPVTPPETPAPALAPPSDAPSPAPPPPSPQGVPPESVAPADPGADVPATGAEPSAAPTPTPAPAPTPTPSAPVASEPTEASPSATLAPDAPADAAAEREQTAASAQQAPPTSFFGGSTVPWFFVMGVGSIVASIGAAGLLLFRRVR